MLAGAPFVGVPNGLVGGRAALFVRRRGVPHAVCKVGGRLRSRSRSGGCERARRREAAMTSERSDPDDDFTWPGLVERAMRAARAGAPDTAADRRLLDVLRGAIAYGCDTALLATTCAEARQYLSTLIRVATAPGDTAPAPLEDSRSRLAGG
jgi:hypothetical protein